MVKSLVKKMADAVLGPPWEKLVKALDDGDVASAKRFLADEEIPIGLLPALALVRPLAKEYQATIDAAGEVENPDDVKLEIDLLQRSRPTSAEESRQLVKTVRELKARYWKAFRLQSDLQQATRCLGGLKGIFPELFGLPTWEKTNCINGLPPAIWNKMVEDDFDVEILCRGPWHKVYRRPPITPKKVRLFAR